ncbi:MAG: hypothetical protein AB1645_02580 [Bacillota bacterium]
MRDWLDRAPDPLTARKLRVLWDSMALAQVNSVPEIYTLQNRIMDRIVAFRPVVFGREVSHSERNRILRQETDRALRREAWVSIAPLSIEVAGDTVELIERRNDLARRAGYADYVDLSLSLASLSRPEVISIINHTEEASAAPYRAFLAEAAGAAGLESVEPWDLGYLVEKATAVPTAPFPKDRIVPVLEDFVSSFGRDPRELGIRIVFHDIPYGGLCVPIDPPSDVRVLANPQDGHNYYHVLFHEYGHCLHVVYAGENSQILQDEPGVFCEGMAELWGWFTFDPEWLRGFGLDDDLVQRVTRAHSVQMMAGHRTLAANVTWEYRAYENPRQDLTNLHAAREARYLLCQPRPVHRWAGGPFPAGYPVYWQNYVLADLIAAATHRALRERFDGAVLGNPEVFKTLVAEYWRPGASRTWREKLAGLTGRDLDPAALVYRWGPNQDT